MNGFGIFAAMLGGALIVAATVAGYVDLAIRALGLVVGSR